MGSICSLNRRVSTWPVEDSGLRLKREYGGEPLVKVTYGASDDYPEGAGDMTILMRKSVYDNLLTGKYCVSLSNHELLVTDASTGYPVRPVRDGYCY